MVGKIIVVALSGIGNTLLATPFLRCLKQCYPEAKIDFLVFNKVVAEVVEGAGFTDEIFTLCGGHFKNLALILKLNRRKYSHSVILFPSNKWQFNLLSFLIGAKTKITHSYRKRAALSFLQDAKVPAYDDLHDADQNLNLLEVFGCKCDVSDKSLTIILRDKDLEFADEFIQQKGLADEFVVGVHPGGGGALDKSWQGLCKRWPEENFAALCDELVALKKAKILVFGGPEEKSLKRAVLDKSKDKDNLFIVNAASLKQTAALIKRCDLFVSNDTGLMHLAVSVGVPTLGILGPTNYKRTSPYGDKGYYIKADLPCSPCLKYPFYSTDSRIKCGKNFECFNSITVEAVIAKLKDLGLI